MTWEELKQQGSDHYKMGKIQLIDLLRSVSPHPAYNAFEIFALCNIMKYALRLLIRGHIKSDVDKIFHYTDLFQASRTDV
jgi:hypothetical protein